MICETVNTLKLPTEDITMSSLAIQEYAIPIRPEDEPFVCDFPRNFTLIDVVQRTQMLHVYVLQKYCDANTREYNTIMYEAKFVWRYRLSKNQVPSNSIPIGVWATNYTPLDQQALLFLTNPIAKLSGDKSALEAKIEQLEAELAAVKTQNAAAVLQGFERLVKLKPDLFKSLIEKSREE